MKKLAGATITLLCLLVCLPASAITPSRHKAAHHKAAANRSVKVTRAHAARRPSPRSKANLRHANTVDHAAMKPQAGLQAASYHPMAEPQSSSSSTASSSTSTRASSKKKAASKKKHSSRRDTQMAPTPDRISEIQSALARGGFYKADPNGKWDADTVDALQKFQSANGLDSSGKLDALTLQKLGLGSDVAGYSTPKGIVEHSCCSMTPSPSHASLSQTAPAASNSSAASTSASTASAAAPVAQDPRAAAGTGPESATPQQNASH